MDMEVWDKSPAILITPEDCEGEDKGKLLVYAKNHPQKFFLLPSSVDFHETMENLFANFSMDELDDDGARVIFPPFAQNLEFSAPVTVHLESGEFAVFDLAALLNEWLSQKETGAYLVTSDKETTTAIKRQLALLGLYMAVYETSNAENAHWEKKLNTVKDVLGQEIPHLQEICQNVTKEFAGTLTKNLVKNLSEGLTELSNFFNAAERKISIQLYGEENLDLARFLSSNFSVCKEATANDADICLFVLSTQPGSCNMELLEKIAKERPQNLIFLVYRPVSGDVSGNVLRSQILAAWQKELSQMGFSECILLFAEGGELEITQAEGWIGSNVTIDTLLASKSCSPKEDYQIRSFLGKIFSQDVSLTGKELLSRLGFWQLIEYCCEARKTNVSSGKLIKKVNSAVDFLVDPKWKGICTSYELETDRRVVSLNEDRLKMGIAVQKIDAAVGETALKAALYDAVLLIDEIIFKIHMQGDEALRKLWQEDFLIEENMKNIYAGRESDLAVTLKEIAKEIEEKDTEALEELKKNLALLLQSVENRCASALESFRSATEDLEQGADALLSLPVFEAPSLSVIELSNIIEEDILLNLVRNNTEVFCTSVGDKSNPWEGASFEYHYLWGSFSVELRETIENSIMKKITYWRKKTYEEISAYIKNFFHELVVLVQTEIQHGKETMDALQASIAHEKEANAADFAIWEQQRSQFEPFISIWSQEKMFK